MRIDYQGCAISSVGTQKYRNTEIPKPGTVLANKSIAYGQDLKTPVKVIVTQVK